MEISIVDIGSNPKALKLMNSDSETITLSQDGKGGVIPLLNDNNTENLNSHKNDNKMDFVKRVAIMLALNPEASDEVIMDGLKEKLDLASKANGYKTEVATLKEQIKLVGEKNIVALVDAQVDKKITADKKEFYVELGKTSGCETLNSLFDNMPGMTKVTDTITLSNNGKAEKVEKFEDLLTLGMGAVTKFKEEKPQEYVKLFKEHYGHEPQL